MGKTALVFPGQGSQSVGMGKDLFDRFPESRAVFEEADRVLGFPLSKVCFEGPEEELKKTLVTQPAILTASVAALEAAKKCLSFEGVAGHSLGAYTALVAAGVLAFGDAVVLVRRRGELMEEAGRGRGTMAVILNLEEGKVREACREASALGVVEPANMNCPGQIVISGEKTAVAAACEKAKELGAKRAMELPVSGPFHSSLMAPAAEGLRKAVEKAPFSAPRAVYYSDIDAVEMKDPAAIAESLTRQLTQPVRWTQVIERMRGDGYDIFIEVGPGRVLGGLIKKISKDAQVLNVGDVSSVEALGKAL